ncbi:MAG TPA: PAS domain-containing protein [Firmicutes bacterium]|nr:PAS domain-containing protein [Candidatus Fermentithermobacillaceae bacterium]
MAIRTRLIRSFVACGFIGAFIASSIFYFVVRYGYIRTTEDFLTKQSAVLKEQFAPYLTGADPARGMSLAKDVAQKTGFRVTLIDSSGKVVLDSHEDPAVMENHLGRPEVQEALKKGRGSSMRWSSTIGRSMLYVAFRVDSPDGVVGIFRLSVPLATLQEGVLAGLPWLLVGLGVSVVVSIIVALVEAARISRPLESMTRAARRMASGEFKEYHYPQADGEIAVLGATLNFLAASMGKLVRDLESSNRKFETVLQSSVSGMVLVGTDRRVVMANKACARILGESRESLEGLPYVRALRNTALIDLVSTTLETGKSQSAEVKILIPAEKIVYAYALPIESAGGREAILILHDITHVRRLETVRTDFVQNISHELKTPVTIIQGYAETLRDAPPEDPRAVKEMAALVAREAERLSELVRSLLELASIESGHLTLSLGEVDPASVVAEVVRRMTPLANKKGLTMVNSTSCERSSPLAGAVPEGGAGQPRSPRAPAAPITADRTLVERALTNLVDNAIKYTPGPGTVEVWAEDAAASGLGLGPGALFGVRDTGPGLADEDKERVFERFYRGSKDRSRETGGTGLGLSLVKHWVAAHGGRTWVESEEGRGSTFYIYLPATPTAATGTSDKP